MASINKGKTHRLPEQGDRNAVLIERLMKDSTVFLSTIQVTATLAGFFFSVSAVTDITQVLAMQVAQWNLPHSRAPTGVVVTIILTYLNLVFGESVPERTALQKAETFNLFCVRPVYHISCIMNPSIKLPSLSTNGFLKLIGIHNRNLGIDVSKEGIKLILGAGGEAGVPSDIEKEMITSISSFDDKRAEEVMVPRQDMMALDINESLKEFLDEILESIHSKIPVYEEEIDNIIGVLSTKALTIEAKRTSFNKPDIRTPLRPAYLVLEDRRIGALFREMQANRVKSAIPIGKYGGASGMVILESLVREIAGDIHEEYEEEKPELTRLELHRAYRMSGGIALFDSKEEMHLHTDSSCDTLSGHLVEQLGYISSREQLPPTVVTSGVDYEILGVEDRVIEWVKLTLGEAKKEQGE